MYKETLKFLYSQLPQYQNDGAKAYKADLANILAMSYMLGNPHEKIKTIHVAGTNGKGSVSHMLASVLQEAGYKVGLYTSPHLKDFRERIKINGEKISENYIVEFITESKKILHDIKPSFFEWTVGLAFDYFASKKVDIAIIETGLGGRLDSTNIITPLVSIITNIGIDHSSILGTSLSAIANEKAGVIKNTVPIVIGETQEEIKIIFIEKSNDCKSKIFFADSILLESYSTDLKGSYQKKNCQTALVTLEILIEKGWKVSKKQIKKGLKNVLLNTSLLGRWQQISENPQIILDVAHNYKAIQEVLKTLKEIKYKNLHIVLGMAKDKEREPIYKILPQTAKYYFCSGENNRLMESVDLRYEAVMHNLHGKHYENTIIALNSAKLKAKKKDLILVMGSFFVVEQVIED